MPARAKGLRVRHPRFREGPPPRFNAKTPDRYAGSVTPIFDNLRPLSASSMRRGALIMSAATALTRVGSRLLPHSRRSSSARGSGRGLGSHRSALSGSDTVDAG